MCCRTVLRWLPNLLAFILCGCTVLDPGSSSSASGDPGRSSVDTIRSAVSTENALSINHLSLNRLSLNRLSLNRLSLNRLSLNRLSLNSLDDIETTEDGRELLRYVALCALHRGDILVAEHERVEYEFPGLLALAPEWEHGPLSSSKQRLMSACLIAHVNAYGQSVTVSMRSAGALAADEAERKAYAVYEGTFFGQVFGGDEIEAYGCQGAEPSIARVHSAARDLRACTDPSDDCGVTSLGRCRERCDTLVDELGWKDCWAGGAQYAEVISVFLYADDADGQNIDCEGDHKCKVACGKQTAGILDCSESDQCKAKCEDDSVCTVDGALAERLSVALERDTRGEVQCLGTDECSLDCKAGSTCEVDCVSTQRCSLRCHAGADCQVNCRNAGDCSAMRCDPGAACLLDCTGATDCGFATCSGEIQSCPGDVIVCGRPCP